MARKVKAKLIMELREQGLSRRSISSTRHMSMESVCEVFDIAAERGIAWEQVKGLGEDEVYRLFYPDRHVRECVFEELDWDYVHKEMAKVGVNLRLLHEEYKFECQRSHKVAMGYTRFCERYGDHVAANNLTKRIDHKGSVSKDAPMDVNPRYFASQPHRGRLRRHLSSSRVSPSQFLCC